MVIGCAMTSMTYWPRFLPPKEVVSFLVLGSKQSFKRESTTI